MGTIEFREAVLQFNDISIDSNSSLFIESLSFEKFAITRLNLKALLFERSFNIEKVLLSSPSLDFLKDTVISGKEIFSKILTPEVISSKSKSAPFSFEIGEVEIESGSFELIEAKKKDFSLGRINLKLSNIGMDDLKVLKGDDPDLNANFNIRLALYDVEKRLDENAQISLDSVVYKKDKRLFEIGGIHLNRLATSNDYIETEVSIQTDFISVNGFSLSHFLSSQDVKFDRLTIANTEIFETGNYLTIIKKKESDSISKGKHFSKFINAFIADTLQVQNFNYRFTNILNDSVDFIDNLNVSIYDVIVDSNFILNNEYIKPIEKSELSSGSIKMHMPEAGINFTCDSIDYSGTRKVHKFIGLRVYKYPSLFSDTSDRQRIAFSTDSFVISGLDEREWIDSTFVELSLHLENPQIIASDIAFGGSNKKASIDFIPDNIVLKNLSLVNGNLDISGILGEVIKLDSFSFEMENFGINFEKEKNPILNWQSLASSFGNIHLEIPDQVMAQVGNGIVDNKDFDFEHVLFLEYKLNSTETKRDTTRFYVNEFSIENFDVKALLNEKRLSIDYLTFTRPEYFEHKFARSKKKENQGEFSPKLVYRRINEKLPDFLSYINIKRLAIIDADLFYYLEENQLVYNATAQLEMQDICFDQDQPDGKFPELTIDQYEFCISDASLVSDRMEINAERICYSNKNDVLILENGRASNTKENIIKSKPAAQFSIFLPGVILEKPDFVPISGGPISFAKIQIDDPEINIRLLSKTGNHHKSTSSNNKLLPFTFLDDSLVINNGKVSITIGEEQSSSTVNIGKLNIDMNDLYKIVGAVDHSDHDKNIFQYLDFHLKDISVNGPDFKTSISNIDYDKQSEIISIQPIKQEVFSKKEGFELRNTIDIPTLSIEQPDIMLVNEEMKSFGARNFLIPTIDIKLESAKSEKPTKKVNIRKVVNDSTIRNFLGNMNYFHIDSTVINNIGFTQYQVTDTGRSTFEIERISLLVDKLKIDSSHFDAHEKRLAEDIIIQLHDKKLVTSDSLYDIKINNITYYYSRDKIVVDSFEVIPRYERETFFKKAGFQTDRMQIKFDNAVFEGVDLLSIIESNKFQVRKLSLNQFKIMDHRDKHYLRRENDFKLMPKQSLINLPFVLNIDTIEVNNSFLLYGEYVDESPKPGEVFFTNFNASIFNLSNISDPSKMNNSIQAHINSDIMDQAKMKLNFMIPLDEGKEGFTVDGNVERTDLRYFNSMTENLFGISIVRGRGGVNIPLIVADNVSSKGTLQFEYKRLKLSMYNRNKAQLSRGLGSGLLDFMLNGVLVKSNNPTFFGKTRTGDVLAIRNEERSFFNYMWKSVMSGLMTTMGFYNKDLRLEKRERKGEERLEFKEEKIEFKNERQLKKAN